MKKPFKPNEVYTDLEAQAKVHHRQMLMWMDVVKIIKQGIVDGNVSFRTLVGKYELKLK